MVKLPKSTTFHSLSLVKRQIKVLIDSNSTFLSYSFCSRDLKVASHPVQSFTFLTKTHLCFAFCCHLLKFLKCVYVWIFSIASIDKKNLVDMVPIWWCPNLYGQYFCVWVYKSTSTLRNNCRVYKHVWYI